MLTPWTFLLIVGILSREISGKVGLSDNKKHVWFYVFNVDMISN
jgi:membrane carboxypeptidase/penicillin-binding protein